MRAGLSVGFELLVIGWSFFSARRNTGGIVSALGDCVCIGIESPRSPHTTK